MTGKSDIPDEIYSLFPILWEFDKRRGGNLSGGQQQQWEDAVGSLRAS